MIGDIERLKIALLGLMKIEVPHPTPTIVLLTKVTRSVPRND